MFCVVFFCVVFGYCVVLCVVLYFLCVWLVVGVSGYSVVWVSVVGVRLGVLCLCWCVVGVVFFFCNSYFLTYGSNKSKLKMVFKL